MLTNWRKYERHPISARYPDIKGQAWEDFLANMSKRKIRGRAITLYEGKILDGYQLYRAAVALDIEPKFVTLPDGEDPEAFVEEANEHRRHESAEAMCARREKRRERVAAMHRDGQSNRAIAEEEDVSEGTVRNDLVVSTAQGCAVEPPEGQITGKDGKKRAAHKPKILCAHCQTLVRKSLALPARCEECSELNRTKRAGQTTRAPRGPHKPGQTLRNYKKEFDTHYGAIVRLFDDMRRELGCGEVGPFLGALRLETELLGNFKDANKLVVGKRK